MTQTSTPEIRPSVCPLDCPDTCSLNVKVQGDTLLDVKGSMANPYTNNVICKKVTKYYPDFVHGDARIQHPLKRVGKRGSGQFKRVSWKEALDLVFNGFTKAIKEHGPESVLPFNYAGPHGELAGGSMDRRFFYQMGATMLNRGPLCGGVRGGAYTSLFGNAAGMPPNQAVNADLIVVWGNNVTVSNLHLAPVLKKARKKGAKLVIIDPKRIKVADQCDMHIQLRPGSDVVLALALAAELERRDALDKAFIAGWVVGFDAYMAEARKYSVADVNTICGVTTQQFNQLADWYAKAKNAAASFGNGIERGRSGGSGLRAAMALQALTGNHGRLGAGVIAKSGVAAPKTQARLHANHLMKEGTRVFNIVDVPEKILDKNLDTPIKAVMIFNHNPVAVHPDQANMIKALMQEGLFVVGCDIVMTDSMALCDVILPASSHFEYDDIYGAYGQNYVQRAAPVIPCVGESLPNTEIFRRLAARFGYDAALFKATDAQLIDDAMDGTHAQFKGVRPSQISVDHAMEMKASDGEVLIMCKNVVPATPSGKIELFCQDYEDRFAYGVPRFEPVPQDHPFVLITPSSEKRTNATFGSNVDSSGPEVVEMNPRDISKLGLTDGDIVTLGNSRADVTFKLKSSDKVLEGVLYSPKGTWRVTSETGYTANALIPSDIRTDIEGGACYNETFVDVRKAG